MAGFDQAAGQRRGGLDDGRAWGGGLGFGAFGLPGGCSLAAMAKRWAGAMTIGA